MPYSVPTSQLAESLARDALRLHGPDARAFEDHFMTLAGRPVAAVLPGDGASFRQALCFPVRGVGDRDMLLPVAEVAPHVIVERPSGHLVCLRLADCGSGRLALGAFLKGIETSLERLPQGPAAWPGIRKSIEMMTRRRVALVDFVLEPDLTHFWQHCFPGGDDRLAASLFQGLPTVPGLGRRQAVAALRDIQSEHYRAALAGFMGGLDGEVILAIRASGLPPSVSRYNTYRRAEPTAARNRIQAAQAVPLLGYLLGEDNHRAVRLRRLVDGGQPLWPALADTVGVPEETVRWLRGKTADDISQAWLGRIPELLRNLAQLPPEKRPRTPEEWTAYTDFALVLDRAAGSRTQAVWLRDLARIGWVPARQKFHGLGAAPSDLPDIEDVLREIAGAVAGELAPHLPLYGYRDYPEWQRIAEAVTTLFLDISVLKQIRTSLRWHALQLLPPGDENDDDGNEGAGNTAALPADWPAPLAEPLRLGGLHAHFLTTPAQLRDEGLRMEHCVGSYADRCLFDGANIVSFRGGDGRSVSTAELRLVDAGKHLVFEVVQHRAQRNGAPPPAAVRALDQLLVRLAADDMQPRLTDMREQLKQRQTLDDRRREWLRATPRAPHRLRALKSALRLHVGYERFLEAGRQALAC